MKSMILAEEIGPAFPELVIKQWPYAGLCESMTFFNSTGRSLKDQVALDMMLDYAYEMRLGQQMMIEQLPVDPWDPNEPARYLLSQSISPPGRI